MNWGEPLSSGQETNRRLVGRLRIDAAQFMIVTALGIMFLALILAAVSVEGAPLALQMPEGPALARLAEPMLVLRESDGSFTTLAPKHAEVSARVNPLEARVTVQHRFRTGPGAARAGVYILPLPTDATPQRISLTVGDRHVEIGLAVESADIEPELFALPIDGIGAYSEITVQFTYDRPVALGDNRFVLALPLPRGDSAEPRISAAGWVHPGAALKVELDPGLPIAELRSPSHGIDIERGPGQRRRIVLADTEVADGRDFVLVWKPADPRASIAALRRYTAAKTRTQPRPGDTLVLRTRPIGRILALAPAASQSVLLTGSPIDDGTILTEIDARVGAQWPESGSAVSSALAGSILGIWVLGALYLATRRSAGGRSSTTSNTGTVT